VYIIDMHMIITPKLDMLQVSEASETTV